MTSKLPEVQGNQNKQTDTLPLHRTNDVQNSFQFQPHYNDETARSRAHFLKSLTFGQKLVTVNLSKNKPIFVSARSE